jgi:pimeloyl-ACP methyl ester carboxylesterase
METQTLQTSKGTIEFTVAGKGQPLLFAHGGHFNCQVTLFHKGFDPEKFRIINPSRPGYGRTTLPGNASPAETAELFITLLDKLNIEKAVAVGISAGGLTAIELAARFPQRISKLVLISSISQTWVPKHASIYMKGRMIFKPPVERFSWKLLNFLSDVFPRLTATTIFREVSTLRPPVITQDEIEELKKMIKKQRSYRGFENDLKQVPGKESLYRVTCPTLVLHSLLDNVVGMEHPEYAAAAIKNASLRTYNNRWGHILWLGRESTQPIADTLAFLQK